MGAFPVTGAGPAAFRSHGPGVTAGSPLVSRTPAAELARLKLAFPGWSLRRVAASRGGGFRARRRLSDGRVQSLHGATVAELEYRLRLLERREDELP